MKFVFELIEPVAIITCWIPVNDSPLRAGFYDVQFWNGDIARMHWDRIWSIPSQYIKSWRGVTYGD